MAITKCSVRTHVTILGDPGALSGGGKTSKRARKKFSRRKVNNAKKSPWGQGFNGLVPNGRANSGFWLVPENVCFFSAQSQSSKTRSRFASSYIIDSCSPCCLSFWGDKRWCCYIRRWCWLRSSLPWTLCWYWWSKLAEESSGRDNRKSQINENNSTWWRGWQWRPGPIS